MKTEYAPLNIKVEAPYYVRALALGLCAYLIGVHLWTWVFDASIFLGGRADFRQLYTAGYMLRAGAGRDLYDPAVQLHFQNLLVSHGEVPLPFIRPPFSALFFAPFSLLSYRAAYLVFLGVNVLLLILCLRLLRPRTRHLAGVYEWLPAALFLAFLPIGAALIQGQDSILLLSLFVAAFVALEQDRDLTAGVLIGAGLFKLQIVLPVAVLFLLWRRWRFSFGFALSAFLAGLLSVMTVGWRVTSLYLKTLFTMSGGDMQSAQFRYPLSPGLMPNLHGFVFGAMAERVSTGYLLAFTVFLSAAAFVFAAKIGRRCSASDGLCLAVISSALVSYYLLIHDLSVLLLPLIVLLDRFVGCEATRQRKGKRILRAAALMFVAPIVISYAPEQFFIVCLPLLGLFLAQIATAGEAPSESPISLSRAEPLLQ